MEHKQARVILNPAKAAEAPADVKQEGKLIDWAGALYVNSMRLAAAGVLATEGSLEKAASVLWWAGFAVPAGYLPEDEADALPGLDSEEALRAWVERDEENIRRAVGSVGFYLAGTAALMAPKETYIPDE